MATEIVILTVGDHLAAGMDRYIQAHRLPWRLYVPSDFKLEVEQGMISRVDAAVGFLDGSAHFWEVIHGRRLPVVTCGCFAPPEILRTRIEVDEGAMGLMAATHLQQAGYRHVALIGHHQVEIRNRRYAACAAACASIGLACDRISTALPVEGRDVWDQDARLVAAIRGLPGPVGLFFHQDRAANWFRAVCIAHGLEIPQDAGILGVDDLPMCTQVRPTLSSIQIPFWYLGYRAGQELQRLLCGQPPPEQPIRIRPLRVVARQSTALHGTTGDALVDRLIQQWRGNTPSLEQLVKSAGVSQPTLSRRFVAATGQSPRQWFARQRIERFTADLLATETPIATLAHAHGFATLRTLERAFLLEHAISPSEFRYRAHQH